MPDVIFNGPEGRLEGRYQHGKTPGAPVALMLHPHPQHGGTMNNKVVYTLYQAFARRGAAVLDADQVGHQVLAEPEVIAAFRQRWGEAVVGPDGQIIRREVAALNEPRLHLLESERSFRF